MAERKMTLTTGWLHLPIERSAAGRYLSVICEGETVLELFASIAEGTPAFYCPLDLTNWKGREIAMRLEGNSEALHGIVQTEAMRHGHPLYPNLGEEGLRPKYHYTARRGWISDANGLFFDGERYHLYYQHNPYSVLPRNASIGWGHAVSTDCVHWREGCEAMRPMRRNDLVASGSCIVDRRGCAGFGCGAVIAAYTRLNAFDWTNQTFFHPAHGQYFAYSTDGGTTFSDFPENPVIPTENGAPWRDPRLTELEDGRFCCSVYETKDGEDCVSFYLSDDLRHWTKASSATDLCECPDFFPLKVRESQETVWVLYGGRGNVRTGQFCDGRFLASGPEYYLDYGPSAYAGQTWTGTKDSHTRRHISWLIDGDLRWDSQLNGWSENNQSYPDMPFSQCMSVVCELSVVRAGAEYRVLRQPIEALETLRQGAETVNASGKRIEISLFRSGDAQLTIVCTQPIHVALGNAWFDYDPSAAEARFSSGRTAHLLRGGALSLRVLTDAMSAEFFLQDEISASYGMRIDETPQLFVESEAPLCAEGQTARLQST